MRRGQLGTEPKQRVIFVWEGAVATLPDYKPARQVERFRVRLHQWDRAVNMWQVQDTALALMWTILARTFYRIDLCVTSRPAGFAKALSERVLRENWPVEYVFNLSATDLGRSLAQAPDVRRVYYGLPEHRWAFGPNGYHLIPGQGTID